MYLFRYSGDVLSHPTGWSGKDFDVAKTNALTPVDAWVETQWMRHGSEQRKILQKIYLTMRALDVNEDVDEILGGKFDPLRINDLWTATTDQLHLCTVEIMASKRDGVRLRPTSRCWSATCSGAPSKGTGYSDDAFLDHPSRRRAIVQVHFKAACRRPLRSGAQAELIPSCGRGDRVQMKRAPVRPG
jgi:hypothetical protein